MISYRNLTVLVLGGPVLFDEVGITIDRKEKDPPRAETGREINVAAHTRPVQVKPDAGEVEKIDGFRVSKIDQEIPVGVEGSVFDLVAKGLGSEANLLRKGE